MKKNAEWWEDFFEVFRPEFEKIPQKKTNAETRFFISKLGLKKGMKFLDCPCGIGRISLPMAKAGMRVTGVDITQCYLDELEKTARRRDLKINLSHCDMRRINYDRQFDAVGNLWTSFGYFKKESDNLLVLKKLFKALKPGGRLVLQLINRDWILTHFSSNGWEEVGGIRVMEKRRFDYATSVNHSLRIYQKDGVEKQFNMELRVYTYSELIAILKKIGFVDVEGYGSIKEEPIDRNLREMIIFAGRPKK